MMRVLIVINIHVLHLLNLAKGLGPTALPAAGTAATAATGRRSSQFAVRSVPSLAVGLPPGA